MASLSCAPYYVSEWPTGKEGTANRCHPASDHEETTTDPKDPQEWEDHQATAGRVLHWQEISRNPAERWRYCFMVLILFIIPSLVDLRWKCLNVTHPVYLNPPTGMLFFPLTFKRLTFSHRSADLVKGKIKGGEQLHDVIQGCLAYLDSCTEFWTEETPSGSRGGKGRKLRQEDGGKPRRGAPSEPAQFLLKSLEDIDAGEAGLWLNPLSPPSRGDAHCDVFVVLELTSGNAEGSLKKAEDVMKIVRGWSEKEVPNRKEVLGSLHSCIGNAFIDLGDTDRALEHHRKDLELAEQWWEWEDVTQS